MVITLAELSRCKNPSHIQSFDHPCWKKKSVFGRFGQWIPLLVAGVSPFLSLTLLYLLLVEDKAITPKLNIVKTSHI